MKNFTNCLLTFAILHLRPILFLTFGSKAKQYKHLQTPKKRGPSLVNNYRGIFLMSISAKIYNKLLLNHLIPHVEPLLRNNQNGFRKGRSTLSQAFSIRRIIEESNQCNVDLALIFVDFSKAFNSVCRIKMLKFLNCMIF